MTDQSNEDNELKEEQKFFTAIKTAIDHEVDAKTTRRISDVKGQKY